MSNIKIGLNVFNDLYINTVKLLLLNISFYKKQGFLIYHGYFSKEFDELLTPDNLENDYDGVKKAFINIIIAKVISIMQENRKLYLNIIKAIISFKRNEISKEIHDAIITKSFEEWFTIVSKENHNTIGSEFPDSYEIENGHNALLFTIPLKENRFIDYNNDSLFSMIYNECLYIVNLIGMHVKEILNTPKENISINIEALRILNLCIDETDNYYTYLNEIKEYHYSLPDTTSPITMDRLAMMNIGVSLTDKDSLDDDLLSFLEMAVIDNYIEMNVSI